MLTLIPATDLARVWPWVRAGLERCLLKAPAHYLPEDVYHELRAGTLTLFTFTSEKDVEGGGTAFVVLRRDADHDGYVLFVFALAAPKGGMAWYGDELMAALDAKAREVGAKRIRMQGRKGWSATGYFVPMATIYEREVNHGR